MTEPAAAGSDWARRWREARAEGGEERGFLDAVERWVLERLRAAPGARLLDAGCGTGQRTRAFRRLGFDAVGVDLDPTRAQWGYVPQVDDGTPLVRGDLHALPFATASVDVLLSASVLQYVHRPTVLAEYARVLRPGGEALFIENLAGHPLARLYRVAHRALGWRHPPHQVPRVHVEWRERDALGAHFAHAEWSAFHLTTPLVLARAVLRRHVLRGPWQGDGGGLFSRLERLDEALLRRLPRLRGSCWLLVGYARR